MGSKSMIWGDVQDDRRGLGGVASALIVALSGQVLGLDSGTILPRILPESRSSTRSGFWESSSWARSGYTLTGGG